MRNIAIQTTLPAGSRIRIGASADQPVEALGVLQILFAGLPTVASAHLGLMEVFSSDNTSYFTYTVGIECPAAELHHVADATVQALEGIESTRWPISVLTYSPTYFTNEALCFYRRAAMPKGGRLTRWFARVRGLAT